MSSDGKQLEGLVAFVERTLLSKGFTVRTNERVFNDEGIQIAEFDVEIRGKVGTTQIAWLIECRDRPGHGSAPGSWIEQLVGRRTRFGFNKVTAVSTTGFAAGAVEFAQAQGIELREVNELSADSFDWLLLRHLTYCQHVHRLDHATILLSETETEGKKAAVSKTLSSTSTDVSFLKSSQTGETATVASAFIAAVGENPSFFDGLEPNGPARGVRIHARYLDEDHFVVETDAGPICIAAIVFTGEVSIREDLVPISLTAEYRQSGTGETISQVASFAPQRVLGINFALEMHRMSETGETHVILRRLGNAE